MDMVAVALNIHNGFYHPSHINKNNGVIHHSQSESASWQQPWSTPPCSYPTIGNSNKQDGILGKKQNHQAHVKTTTPYQASHQRSSQYAPTDIWDAMHTFSISPSDDQWYMDTEATLHMTTN